MGGRKKTFRLNPMVGAPLRRKARRAFGVVGVVVMLALASTMVLIEIAFGSHIKACETSRGSSCTSERWCTDPSSAVA